MTSSKDRPKYLRKYDLPIPSLKSRTHTTPHRRPFQPIPLINAPRTKDVLSQLVTTKENNDLAESRTKIDQYFTMASEPYREICRKTKNGLLIRQVEPRPLHYDADFTPVSRRAPSWGFIPKRNKNHLSVTPTFTPPIPPQSQQKRRPKTRGLDLGELLDRDEGQVGEARETDPKLHYDAEDLGKCTAQILYFS
jgi:hypothetical protein